MGAAVPRWALTEKDGFSGGPEVIGEALYGQRRRFLASLMDFTPSAWSARSRCAKWSVHEVVRHLADVAELHRDRLAGRQGRFARYQGFDLRTTPLTWLAESSWQTPEDTYRVLCSLVDEEHGLFASRAGQNENNLIRGPLGRDLHWSVLSLHILWDAWMHERDIAIPLGLDIKSTEAELRLMTLYGLLVAITPSARAGDHVRVSLALSGSPDDSYEISSTDDDIEVATGATPYAELRGTAGPVLDSLAGRGPAPAELFGSTAEVVERLSRLRGIVA
jgi:uncharacterized protein (TIGR03083 family)